MEGAKRVHTQTPLEVKAIARDVSVLTSSRLQKVESRSIPTKAQPWHPQLGGVLGFSARFDGQPRWRIRRRRCHPRADQYHLCGRYRSRRQVGAAV